MRSGNGRHGCTGKNNNPTGSALRQKQENEMTAVALIVGHMNAPYGSVLDEQAVCDSLRSGKLSARSEPANAILAAMFCEIEPQLIVRCAVETKVPIAQVNRLYEETLAQGLMRCPAWEHAVEMLT
jgi:hypothetical protein